MIHKSSGFDITSSAECIGISAVESYKIHVRVGDMATGLCGYKPKRNTNVQEERHDIDSA
jgi:hypothetical protein